MAGSSVFVMSYLVHIRQPSMQPFAVAPAIFVWFSTFIIWPDLLFFCYSFIFSMSLSLQRVGAVEDVQSCNMPCLRGCHCGYKDFYCTVFTSTCVYINIYLFSSYIEHKTSFALSILIDSLSMINVSRKKTRPTNPIQQTKK